MIKSFITLVKITSDGISDLIFISFSSLVFYQIGIGHKLKINCQKKTTMR
jgi:hypothetical protein